MDWSLTYLNGPTNQFELCPFVSMEEAKREFDLISPNYIPRTVSKVARVTGQGDADLISDAIAIRRFENQRKAFGGRLSPKTPDEALPFVQALGRREQVYLPKTFGQYLERVRRRAGLSKSAVTQQLGLANGCMAQYEQDKVVPTIAIIRRFETIAQQAGLQEGTVKREYICLKRGPEQGTLGDIVARERWFAQIGVRELAAKVGKRPSFITMLEADRFTLQNRQFIITLEKIAIALSSNRILELTKELRHSEFRKNIT